MPEKKLKRNEMIAVLAKVRWRRNSRSIEIFIEGKWRALGRTTQSDKNRTLIRQAPDEDAWDNPIAYLCSEKPKGAILTETALYVIE